MDQKVINAIVQNLEAAETLVVHLSPELFKNESIGPYHSSVGSHLRHILDIFNCAALGLESGHVDLIMRERNEGVETVPALASEYLSRIISFVKELKDADESQLIQVTDDLGVGEVTLPYTVSALLAQAHSHAIHHFACIGYILEQLDVQLPEVRFGYNPTTPEKV